MNNQEILTYGDQQLFNYLWNIPNFIEESVKLIFDNEKHQRYYILSLFQNIILLNWQSLQHQTKQMILTLLVNGLKQEKQIHIQENIATIFTQIMKIDPDFQQLIKQFLLIYTDNPQIVNILIQIYRYNNGQDLTSYNEVVLQNMLSLQQPTSNVYHLVYLVIKRIFGCQQTNIEIQQQSLDSTLIQWVDRFSQVFQQQDEQGSQIYIIKALSLICKEMNNQKKYIRKAILPQITSFFEGLTNSIQYLEEIKFLDENFEQVLNQEVQLFYTLQILTETLNQLMCNNIIYSSLLKILSLPIQNINIDHFILQDNPTVIQSVLKFFKQQLSCKQTQQNVKQLLLKYLQQQVEMVGQYIIIAQYSSDLFDQNEYMVIIDNILKKQCNNQNQAFQLQKLVALTNLYILTKGQVDRFRKIFQLNVQLLNSQLNIVNFLNLGKLCAHASKNNTLDEQVFKCIVDQSDIQFPYQSDIQFPSIEQNTAHILFDSILQMLKLCKTLQFPILQNIYQYWTKYPNDSKVAQIFYEVLDILASVDPKSVQQTFSVNDEIIWLKVNSIIAKYQPQLLIKFIPQIANLLLDFHEYTQQGIMLLKKLLQYNTIDQVTMKVVFQILEIQLNTYEEQQLEAYTENVHDLLLVVWNIYMNRQITIQLLNNIISKIMHTQISATVNGLTTILCAIYLQNQNQFLQWLQSNSENTQQLFSRWLCFASILESKSLLQLQINAIYQFTQLPFLDQMHYVDPFVKYVIPLKAKMMEFLIQKQYQCQTINQIQTEFENDISVCYNLLKPIQISFEHLKDYSQYLSQEQKNILKKNK